ncbi:hypothetical protein DL95DRAFT_353461 [Leptodontidium sp. 2 PMI_412]|nr:hypothetical protein DL95DRAFT_353461 [Leptodontidium sp. 2 PMI_412]
MSGSPHIKFEHSPADSLADSFVSTPNTAYPSLFHTNDTMDPSEVMTPRSYDDESMFGGSMNGGSTAGTPAPEKKPVKKRKSWGQQLPEPKTNLPPRKRAKTEDEKEQRRVERVLRNRRAAQSSRERKRQEVEALEAQKLAVEQTNQDLMRRLADAEAKNALLERQLEQMSGGMNAFHSSSVASSPGASEQLRQTPRPSITFSQNLFGPRDADPQPISTQSLVDPQVVQTVNPASLSPEMGPVVDSTSNANSSDLTQHPAAMLCDLPYLDFLNNRVLPAANQFDHFFDNLAPNNDGVFEDSHFDEFLNHDDQPAPEIQLLACNPHLARPLSDATMVVMRLASEQQLRDCLSTVDASRLETRDSASVETLMTLLWAIRVIERENKLEAPKLDAATVARQSGELDSLFRLREHEGVSFVSHGREVGVGHKQKSLDHWRTAFKHDRP